MDSLFQLGVTRYATPDSSSNGSPAPAATNGGSYNGNGSGEGHSKEESGGKELAAAPEDVEDYLTTSVAASSAPAGGIVYSEGAQKTDLLY
ncbi:uncharacterized protein Dvir_GJ26454 [Drosophila virilis]|uniref:Uncharacterized protein n=2 Tax=Drosophila virilis TaxID=7244 RepID=A0A0Q9WNU4_DROVI|nr:uncharacterized protein Dvir_GJ26454 [Drosophila virilis]